MARYRVSVTVYKDSKGKTLAGPTFLGVLADVCAAIGLMFFLGGILALMENGFSPISLLSSVAAIVIACLCRAQLKKLAERKAQAAYLASMSQESQETPVE